MNENPFASPREIDDTDANRFQLLIGLLYGFALILSVVAFSYSSIVLKINIARCIERGRPIPFYVLLMGALIIGCVSTVVISYIRFRARRHVSALAFVGLAIFGLIFGPWLSVFVAIYFLP